MRIGPEDLKPFQTRAAAELSAMVLEYGSGRFKHRYDSDTGVVLPFVCRLKAITGAGKTPILAVTASRLKTGIVLWTTPRGAVVSQTYDNLKPGGKYADLLPEGTSIFMLPEMSEADWMSVLNATHGLSILLATVASFNQDGNMLRVHRKGSGGTPSRWEMLGNYNEGVMSRHRSLYVFYDEGHGATQEQFQRLAQLNPRAFVIASASPFPPDLAYLLPGKVYEEKAKSLEERTVTVPTKQVVEIGLLKQRLYFTVCHTSQDSALKEAETKYLELKVKLERLGLAPIACFIVNSTERAIDIWEGLLKLGVSKEKIAVHVNGAKEEVYRRYGTYLGVRDTYSGKKHSDRSPEALRRGGYTHIIWNLTLREGWDEPLAYVAYIDGKGRSETDITQKIGRFLRQPNAEPFDDADLNAAYFYFNVPDAEFAALIKRTQEELELEGHEILRIDDQYRWPSSREVVPRMTVKVPKIKPRLGDPAKNDQIVLKLVPMLEASDRQAPGRIERVVLDLKRGGEDESLRQFRTTESNDSITAWDFIATQLQRIDNRIVNNTGSIFTSSLPSYPKMKQEIQYGSPAIEILERVVRDIKQELEDQIELTNMGGLLTHEIGPFKLVSPDVKGVSLNLEERYRVRAFKNSIHPEYNGMNSFEVKVAEALDRTGKMWCRNPATKAGYAIPIPIYGADNANFMPDFLFWSNGCCWAIDPKGKHLLEPAIVFKLLDIADMGIRIAFILEGAYVKEGNAWVRSGKDGFTLVKKYPGGIKGKVFNTLDNLLEELTRY